MNVNLTPDLEALIHHKVRSGFYNNQSEVMREALRLMEQQDRQREAYLERLRGALAEGIAQADRGECLDGAKAVAGVRKALRARRISRKKRK